MRLSSVFVIVMLAVAGMASNVNAQCDKGCNQGCPQCSRGCNQCGASSCNGCSQCGNMPLLEAFCMGYRANVQWPAQYIPAARRSVFSAYDAMTNNGWRRQNLLGTYHFDPETNELTEAGRLKVNWITTQNPQHRRNVFVQRGADELQTAQRIASVQSWSENVSSSIGPVDVRETHIVAEGRSAGTVDSIFTGFRASQRPPVLPISSGTSSSATQ